MALQKFIEIFGGRKSLDLCQYLAIAHTNTSMYGVGITPYEAHKHLLEKPLNPHQYDYTKTDWLALRKELTTLIKDNKSDKSFLDNQISELLMEFSHTSQPQSPSPPPSTQCPSTSPIKNATNKPPKPKLQKPS